MANKLAPQKKPTVPQRSLPQRLSPKNLFGQKAEVPQKGATPQKGAAATVKAENRFVKFYREIRSELRKVVWPSRQTAINLTILVVAVSVAVGLILGVVDIAFKALFEFLIGL